MPDCALHRPGPQGSEGPDGFGRPNPLHLPLVACTSDPVRGRLEGRAPSASDRLTTGVFFGTVSRARALVARTRRARSRSVTNDHVPQPSSTSLDPRLRSGRSARSRVSQPRGNPDGLGSRCLGWHGGDLLGRRPRRRGGHLVGRHPRRGRNAGSRGDEPRLSERRGGSQCVLDRRAMSGARVVSERALWTLPRRDLLPGRLGHRASSWLRLVRPFQRLPFGRRVR